MTDPNRMSVIARRILIGVGIVFVVCGTIVTTTYLLGVIPSAYNWQCPMFLALGLLGVLVAWFLLPNRRRLSAQVLAAVYIP